MSTTPEAKPYRDAVAVERLVAGYGAGHVLDDVSFRVAVGEICVVLGPSGCGKSTLLRHLLGLVMPIAGDVAVLGVNLATADEPEREATLARTGMLFQSGALLASLPLIDNVALPLVERGNMTLSLARDIARFKLELVGLGEAALKTPPNLSGGMRKRAALARAIALDPEVLFCDEPTAGLDPLMAAELDELLLGLRAQFGMSMVVVTHELPSIRAIADRAVMLHGGKVVASGTLEEVEQLRRPEVRTFFDRQATPTAARRATLGASLQRGV